MGDLTRGFSLLRSQVFHHRVALSSAAFRYRTLNLWVDTQKWKPSADALRTMTKGAFSLNESDYLEGRSGNADAMVRDFLKRRCDYECGAIFLLTMPKVLGYVFNPVSFWCSFVDGALDACLVEVNNTFGERHFYFIRPTQDPSGAYVARKPKAFHVSPFLPIEGDYTFRLKMSESGDLLQSVIIDHHRGDTLILRTRVANTRVESIGPRLIIENLAMTALVTMRIHLQAAKLWLRRVTFYSKPNKPKRDLT